MNGTKNIDTVEIINNKTNQQEVITPHLCDTQFCG